MSNHEKVREAAKRVREAAKALRAAREAIGEVAWLPKDLPEEVTGARPLLLRQEEEIDRHAQALFGAANRMRAVEVGS